MSEQILIVDDDHDICTITRLALTHVGKMSVQCAHSAEAAKALLPSLTPDLILLDVMMPGTNGTSLFGWIRELDHLKNTPIVFMTARTRSGDVERYLAMGAAGFIGKPFDPMTLADRLRAILASTQAP